MTNNEDDVIIPYGVTASGFVGFFNGLMVQVPYMNTILWHRFEKGLVTATSAPVTRYSTLNGSFRVTADLAEVEDILLEEMLNGNC